jgi:hypothetical protein
MEVPPKVVPRLSAVFLCIFLLPASLPAGADGDWPRWRGPNDDGMARGDAPLHWSDTEHISWKAIVPGRGHSSPVVWGDRIFVTTGVPTGNAPTGSGGSPPEHRFMVLCYDCRTGKLLWERVARIATPHQAHHSQYGSFASNSPITDGKHVIASFGSRGLYCYTPSRFSKAGKLVMQIGQTGGNETQFLISGPRDGSRPASLTARRCGTSCRMMTYGSEWRNGGRGG